MWSIIAAIVVVFSLAVAAYLVLDPGLEVAEGSLQSTTAFMQRGESWEQLLSLNGRVELWDIICREIRKSPICGWGYFVTSETGMIVIWSFPGTNMSAHNVVLQVLVSTGVIGVALFACALAVPAIRVLRSASQGPEARALAVFVMLLWTWHFGWGQLCSSFMGPIAPETVVFYSTFGLALSCAPLTSHGRTGCDNQPPQPA